MTSYRTYRQCFRATRRKEGKPYIELAPRMANLFCKWTADCETEEALTEKLSSEQLLNTMLTDLRIWLVEKKAYHRGRDSMSKVGRLGIHEVGGYYFHSEYRVLVFFMTTSNFGGLSPPLSKSGGAQAPLPLYHKQ